MPVTITMKQRVPAEFVVDGAVVDGSCRYTADPPGVVDFVPTDNHLRVWVIPVAPGEALITADAESTSGEIIEDTEQITVTVVAATSGELLFGEPEPLPTP